jgi:cytidylate kinase
MIITLSRQFGSFGDMIAARVAETLGLQLADREYVYRAAAGAGVPAQALEALAYEGQRSLAAEILNSMRGPAQVGVVQTTPVALPGMLAPMLPPASAHLVDAARALAQVIREIAAQGNVLVLGQGGQAILGELPGACHVQVVAPLELRAARVAEREHLSLAAARRLIRERDRARGDYVDRFFGIHWLDPVHYHLLINTGRTPPDIAVSLVIQASQMLAAAT